MALAAASLAVLGYLWGVLGDRGLNADATGTSGYTTPLEAAGLIFGLLGVLLFSALVFLLLALSIRRRRSVAGSKIPKRLR